MAKRFRLTWFSRLLIVALIVGLVYLGIRTFLPGILEEEGQAATTERNEGSGNDNSSTNSSTATSSNASSTLSDFNYTPPKPRNGKLKGVVELGAAGFNSFVINVDKDKNWDLIKAEWGNSLVIDGLSTGDDVRIGLKKYIASMLDKHNVNGQDIHFVVSSGAQKEESTAKIIKGLKGLGYVVNTVTASGEGKYALKSALPKYYYDDSFVMDIGSGNTKLSWVDNGSVKALEAPGAKYYKKGMSDDDAYRSTTAKAVQIPQSKRSHCFIIGGVPFGLAKRHRKNKERFTVLKLPSEYKADGEKEKAGLNIYKAVVDKTKCQTYIFDWNANFTIGFLLEQDF